MNILRNLPLIGKYFEEDFDWHNPEAILNVISQKELNNTKKSIRKDIDNENVINPKSLFYLHKYVNARFNEKTFNINDRFLDKQNKLEQLYSTGKAEMYSTFSEYEELMDKVCEAEKRYKKAIIALDPSVKLKFNDKEFYDDTKEIKEKIDSLPEKLEW